MASNSEKKMRSIIKRLDAAREALADLTDLTTDRQDLPVNDTRVRLQLDLREFTDYLEEARWWRKA